MLQPFFSSPHHFGRFLKPKLGRDSALLEVSGIATLCPAADLDSIFLDRCGKVESPTTTQIQGSWGPASPSGEPSEWLVLPERGFWSPQAIPYTQSYIFDLCGCSSSWSFPASHLSLQRCTSKRPGCPEEQFLSCSLGIPRPLALVNPDWSGRT